MKDIWKMTCMQYGDEKSEFCYNKKNNHLGIIELIWGLEYALRHW